jgi:hypothetical protein
MKTLQEQFSEVNVNYVKRRLKKSLARSAHSSVSRAVKPANDLPLSKREFLTAFDVGIDWGKLGLRGSGWEAVDARFDLLEAIVYDLRYLPGIENVEFDYYDIRGERTNDWVRQAYAVVSIEPRLNPIFD